MFALPTNGKTSFLFNYFKNSIKRFPNFTKKIEKALLFAYLFGIKDKCRSSVSLMNTKIYLNLKKKQET